MAVELMVNDNNKRPYTTHICIYPRLMTSRWIKQLGKANDCILSLPFGGVIWDETQHEPLVITAYFPLFVVNRRDKSFSRETWRDWKGIYQVCGMKI